jgi:hypothetical protein
MIMDETTSEATEQQPATNTDPMDSLDADVAKMHSEYEGGEEAAPVDGAETAQQPEEPQQPQGWEEKYNTLNETHTRSSQEVRQWFGEHFDTEDKYSAFVDWSKHYGGGGPAPAQVADEPADVEAEEDDIFVTVDQNQESLKTMRTEVDAMKRAHSIQSANKAIAIADAEATRLAGIYPTVAGERGRRAMMKVAIANMDQGLDYSLEVAAKELQSLYGDRAAQAPAPGTAIQKTIPTVIRGGGAGQSAAVRDADPREAAWYSEESIKSMDVFDLINRDTRGEFGIRH